MLNGTKSLQGKFQRGSDEALVVLLPTGEQNLTRQSVLRVSSNGQSDRWRKVGIGAAIGLGAGAAIGAARGDSEFGCGLPALVFGVVGVPIGAGLGAALPSGGWRDVYRAR